MRRPRNRSVPKQNRRGKVEQREYEADDKGAEEKVAEEDDSLAFHAAISLADASDFQSPHTRASQRKGPRMTRIVLLDANSFFKSRCQFFRVNSRDSRATSRSP